MICRKNVNFKFYYINYILIYLLAKKIVDQNLYWHKKNKLYKKNILNVSR